MNTTRAQQSIYTKKSLDLVQSHIVTAFESPGAIVFK